MKIIMVASLVMGVYATTTSTSGYDYAGDYMRLAIVDINAAAGDTNNDTACNANHKRWILVRILPTRSVLTEHNGAMNETQGACVNFKATTALTNLFNSTFDKSFAIRATGVNTTFVSSANASTNCQGAWADQATGFTFASYASGEKACGKTNAGANKDGIRIEDSSANGLTVEAMIHVGKKNLPVTITGPFSDATCLTLAPNQVNSFPLVIPLADSTSAGAWSEKAISTTSGVCTQWEKAAAAPDAFSVIKAYTTSTTGELVIETGLGTGSTWTDVANCTAGTSSGEHRVTFTITETGHVNNCVQAYNHAGTTAQAGKYFKLAVFDGAIGTWPSLPGVNQPPVCSPGTSSPAEHASVSVMFASVIALIAMMM